MADTEGAPEEPPLSSKERAVWTALKRLGDQSLTHIGSAIARATELTGTDFQILSRLEELGAGELIQRKLAASLGWDKSRLSYQLTRMQTRGLVKRAPAEAERGVVVRWTPAGCAALKQARPVHARAVRDILAHVRPAEAEVLLRLIDRMNGRDVAVDDNSTDDRWGSTAPAPHASRTMIADGN